MPSSVFAALRQLHAATPPRLSRFALRPPKAVEVEFSDRSAFYLSAEFLRVYSPAVDSKIRSMGGEKVIFGRRHVGIMSAEPIGNYGVRILFDDLHKTGIYTWDYLYHLGSHKFTLMRSYIKTLKNTALAGIHKGETEGIILNSSYVQKGVSKCFWWRLGLCKKMCPNH
ncbi:hypothetical protein HPP92_007225 [Vanilla planifolia]|uniref:Gamma-butyrobetaine hydroxylase-like N-terminal domain-containing protein n=1 Tax=Vanilla planifolia TaxID=51239 RepID=A0A835RG85_VANPL|nr:hypothetical protein HPP92_007225 [Vanilla planifolia]